MDSPKVSVLVGREWTRPLHARVLAAAAAASILLTSLLGYALYFRLGIELALFLTVLSALPVGALIAVRDRASGMAPLLQTSPARWRDAGAAQMVAASGSAAAVALIVGAFALGPVLAGHVGAEELLAHVGVALLAAVAAAVTGLLIGTASGAQDRLALTVAFLIAFAWLVLYALPDLIVSLVPEARPAVRLLSGVSPLAWADRALAGERVGATLGLVGVAASATLGWLALRRMQDHQGWREDGVASPRARTLAALAVVLLAATAASALAEPAAATGRGEERSDATTPDGLRVSARWRPEGSQVGRIQPFEQAGAILVLSFSGGAPDRDVTLDVRASSREVDASPKAAPPSSVRLDATGSATVEIPFQVALSRIEGQSAEVAVALVVDGAPLTHGTSILFGSALPPYALPATAFAAAAGASLLLGARVLHRRLNA